MELISDFFETARQREEIRVAKEGDAQDPWTGMNPVFRAIFREWRFCNVRREDDKTTVWFREHVRSKVAGLRAVEAVVIFRWFNRVETGVLVEDLLLDGWNEREARRRLRGVRPLITGAYMIKTVTGLDKLEGLLAAIRTARPLLRKTWSAWGDSLQRAHADLVQVPYLGRFLAYEVVTDLRWTDVLDRAQDVNTWASAGPGCAHGLGRVVANNSRMFSYTSRTDQDEMLAWMGMILEMSRTHSNWPRLWPAWEMREVEHWACEFDKIERARAGERLKRRYL
jgi:hypothetical protein